MRAELTQETLQEWRDNPVTRSMFRALRLAAQQHQHQICRDYWASGQDSPARLKVQALGEVVDFLAEADEGAVNEWLRVEAS